MKNLTVIKKNSLYFSDDISKLLHEYVNQCSEITHGLSQKMQNGDEIDNDVIEEVTRGAARRDIVLEQIKEKFKEEIGYQGSPTLSGK